MNQTVLSPVEIVELVGDLELPCDFYIPTKSLCRNEPAEWVLYRKPCCAAKVTPAIACTACKEARVMDLLALECHHCGHIFEHAPDAYSMIEKLDKRGSR